MVYVAWLPSNVYVHTYTTLSTPITSAASGIEQRQGVPYYHCLFFVKLDLTQHVWILSISVFEKPFHPSTLIPAYPYSLKTTAYITYIHSCLCA